MTEFELFEALRPRYPALQYALLPQAASGTGSHARRHADALALSLWPSRGLHLSGFEIKTYRGDWLRELKNPEKAEDLARFCNYWWIVALPGVVLELAELPQPWGLLVWNAQQKRLTQMKASSFREPEKTPDLPFLAALLRRAQTVCTPAATLEAEYRRGLEEGRKEKAERQRWELEEYAKLKATVAEFEKAAGFTVHKPWHHPAEVGRVVNEVISGRLHSERRELLAIARRLVDELAPSEPGDGAGAVQGDGGADDFRKHPGRKSKPDDARVRASGGVGAPGGAPVTEGSNHEQQKRGDEQNQDQHALSVAQKGA